MSNLDPGLREWLLDTDPALRWQVERDLMHAPAEIWEATRARVATEGMGAALLAHQDADGQWAGGAYFPAGFSDDERETLDGGGQPYTATTWTLNTLRDFGLDAAALKGTAAKLAKNSRWEYDDLPYWGGEVDCCINAFTLANGVWLGADVTELAAWFPEHRQPDGGWNCDWVEGSTRSSFHSTLNSLKGILAYEIATGGTDELRAARHAGEAYLLERHLMRGLRSGEQVANWATLLAYPFRWVFTLMSALDYFRLATIHDGKDLDPRLADAIEVLRAERQPDGTWIQEYRFPGRTWIDIDVPIGERSPWLTFYGTRILDWWDENSRFDRA